MFLLLVEGFLEDFEQVFINYLIVVNILSNLDKVYLLEMFAQELLGGLRVACALQSPMHLRVDLFVVWLPKIGDASHALRKGDVVEFPYGQVKGFFVSADASQENTLLLEQIVLREKLEDLVSDV